VVNDDLFELFVLRAEGGALEIEIGETGWSECWFKGRERVHLGSESAGELFSLLLTRVIQDQGQDAGEIRGLKVKWVLSFAELFSRLYVHATESERLLFFINLQGATVGELRLSSAEIAEWRINLRARLLLPS
jgi:hypothetical protein